MSESSESLAEPVAETDALVGRRIGKYEIVRTIGRGGMGTVYEALNTTIGKRVAMKFVGAEMARNREAVARFQREAEAASAVESAHIVQIFDSGTSDEGVPYLVMELLRGEDLGHRIKRCGRLDVPEAAHVTAQILRGLHRAHQAGIIHRDLKPDNVFLVDRDDDSSFAKVLDFGISKIQRTGDAPAHTLTRQGTVLGTPFYMSPEQAQAMPDIDGRADLWSVGAILFECLTGRPPHNGGTYEQVIINICMKDVDDVRMHNPLVPEPMAQVIAKALRRERAERFASARDFLDALAAASGGAISAPSGRVSGEDAAVQAMTATPGLIGRTPRAAGAAGDRDGLAPTLDARAEIPSKVGWSTGRGLDPARGRRRFAALAAAVVVLGAGALGASFALRAPPPPPDTGAAAQLEVEVKLDSNVKGARFFADGAPLADGVVRGARGAVKRVRVEAEGFSAVEQDVALDPSRSAMTIRLEAPAPVVDTGPAAPDPDASAGKSGAASPARSGHARTPAAPVMKPPATKPTGVAGGLQLKED